MNGSVSIIGAALAGAKAAEALPEEGFDGRVVLIGQEAVGIALLGATSVRGCRSTCRC